MRNVALFVVLAVLTVAALVAWNITSKRSTAQPSVANAQPTPAVSITATPTPETGGALRRIFNGGLFGGGDTTPTPSSTPSISGSLGAFTSPTVTPLPTVTVGPTPIGGYTKGGVPVSTPIPSPTRTLGYTAPTVTPNPSSVPQPTSTPQPANVVVLIDGGFNPDNVSIKVGTMIRFVNDSNQNMWIVADNSTFDMGQSVIRNGVYEYRFTSTGEWFYHNKENSNQKGKIVVTN